ncbi:MAG: endonuclease/exonuclease/phosphatase family protein [Chloroflexota bacterium]|nr:endonuclease/exonuclease/phosphatase family protein [Chloroflexota bacterium]
MTRVVAWNIRAGGGVRVGAIAANLAAWGADVAALCEFRATPPSRALAEALADQGLTHQVTTADPRRPALNRLLVASRWPLRRLRLASTPQPRANWLPVRVESPAPFTLASLHIPIAAFAGQSRFAFHAAVLRIAGHWRRGPALIAGDTNTGRIDIDEEAPTFGKEADAWMADMERAGWRDAFRALHGNERAYTWYSPNAGNGFRLDQAFVNRALLPRVAAVRYEWGRVPGSGANHRRDAVSDHAALLLDLSG